MSFCPPKTLKRIFPPLVTGPTVMLIGIKLIGSAFINWGGGASCQSRPATGLFALCPNINAPRPLPWGSAEFIGLGFLVFVSISLGKSPENHSHYESEPTQTSSAHEGQSCHQVFARRGWQPCPALVAPTVTSPSLPCRIRSSCYTTRRARNV